MQYYVNTTTEILYTAYNIAIILLSYYNVIHHSAILLQCRPNIAKNIISLKNFCVKLQLL